MINLIKKNKAIIKLLLIGILVRLIFMFFFNSTFDFFNILALSKSVADTGSLIDGFFVLKRNSLEVQLYGKIYYQLIAFWLGFLETIKILEIKYLFDTKPYQGLSSYMEGLFRWGPGLYQLISIKFLQFFYDFIFLYFIYQIAKVIRVTYAKKILIFWAFTPFLMIVPYAVFQSDFAMLTCFVAGIFFWMRGVSESEDKLLTKNKILTFVFLSLGAIIKQVPILMIPFAIISFSRNIKFFVVNSILAGFFYLIFGQPWAKDSALIKQFFLMSRESTAILNFQINSVSIFLFLYFLLILIVFVKKRVLFSDNKNILYLTTFILTVIYLTEDSTLLFPQFNIWIMPFLALLSLIKPEYGVLLIAPITGFLKRIMIGVDLSGLLNPTFGYGFAHLLDYKYFTYSLVNPDLVGLFLTSLMTVFYFYLILIICVDLFSFNKLNFLRINFKDIDIDLVKITKFIVIGYSVLFIIDFVVKTRLTIIPTTAYQGNNKQIILSDKPLSVEVFNRKGKTINSLEVRSKKNEISYVDFTVFKFVDDQNNVIHIQKINDFLFPTVDYNFNILLDKPIKNKKFKILIYKERGYNRIAFFSAKLIGDITGGSIYDKPSEGETVHLNFPGEGFELHLRGQYYPYQMFKGMMYHVNTKPKFFIAYFFLIILLVTVILFLHMNGKNYEFHQKK